jgi:hypothetical protein
MDYFETDWIKMSIAKPGRGTFEWASGPARGGCAL